MTVATRLLDLARRAGCLLALPLLMAAGSAQALSPADALTLAAGQGDERVETLNRLVTEADPRAVALIEALADGSVQVQGEQVLVLAADGSAADAVTGASAPLSDTAEDAVVNNRLRSAIETALAARDLFGGDAALQIDAATLLRKAAFDEPDASQLPLVEKALAGALDAKARTLLEQAKAAMQLASDDEAEGFRDGQSVVEGETR